ncbi:MAG: TraB/GumN family protein [Pseudomonadota bacterium]
MMLCSQFRSLRSIAAGVLALALAASALAGPAAARITRGPAATAHCVGSDLLAEIARDSPEAHARVLAAARETENDGAILWRIERVGLAPSYLFGTIHVTDSRVTAFSPETERILGTVDRVALEIADLSPAAATPVMQKAAGMLVFTDGQRLDKLLSKDEYEKVKGILSGVGVPGAVASLVKPWFVSMVLSVSDCERKKAESGGMVVDSKIAEMARARGIEVIGLETIEGQLTALASIPLGEQVAGLKSALRLADRAHDMMETTLQMYIQRRMGAAMPLQRELARRAGVEKVDFEGFERELIEKRNRVMRDGVLGLLEKGNALVAVGALHLVGRNGLVAMLREAGYTLTPIE